MVKAAGFFTGTWNVQQELCRVGKCKRVGKMASREELRGPETVNSTSLVLRGVV